MRKLFHLTMTFLLIFLALSGFAWLTLDAMAKEAEFREAIHVDRCLSGNYPASYCKEVL